MRALRWAWNPAHYWPYGLITVFALFLLREVWALAAGRPQDTLSWWVWAQLKIVVGESPSQWTASAFLAFGAWVVVVVWLTFHFWFRRFT